jgi:hypothetical protein
MEDKMKNYLPIIIEGLQTPVSDQESKRNADMEPVDWQFSTDDARSELKWLYHKI